jgi:acetyltransferase-like isoleucine patch superfamily enzyme
MKRIIVRDDTPVLPFNEPARELRILNKPLKLLQRDLLARYCKGFLEIDSLDELPTNTSEELLICKDNLYFNEELLDTFVAEARKTGRACQIAFSSNDRAITAHALPLQEGIRPHPTHGHIFVADLYYYPEGLLHEPAPLVIDTQPYEMGYYHIPSYMAGMHGELVFQVPNRVFLSIENWVHIYIANTPMGMFAWARQLDEKMQRGRLSNLFKWKKQDLEALPEKIRVVLNAFWEKVNPFEEHWRNHFLASKSLVKVGKNCSIDPTAIIHGPTVIGDNVYIGPGVVIANSLIGNNVNIMQGCQIMLSVISDRCFLPFNSAYFMSSMMENSMAAQNTTIQLAVIGRNTFIGANNCFTDFNLREEPIRTYYQGRLEEVNMPVLGSAIGHNCKIGSGFVMYPGRMIGSNTTLILDSPQVNLLRKNINVPGISADMNIPGPGSTDDDSTDEARQVVYRWPRFYNPDTGDLTDPPGGEKPPDIEQVYDPDTENLYHADADTIHHGAHTPEPQENKMADMLQPSSHKSHAHVLRIGG